jgi:tripartite-type tricarboxylate transporter receptor subunit TctC
VIVNQPGASGSVGAKSAWDAPHDGYTWTAGAASDLGTYPVLGMLDTQLKDWALFLDVANVSVIGVNPDAPYQDVTQLLDAMKAKPGEVSVATAGLTSAGHNAMEAIAQQAGVTYKHVTYDGGNPAVIATVAGETEVTTQLASEQAEMIRAGRHRAARALRLRHHPAGHQVAPGHLACDQLLRYLDAQGCAGRGSRDHGPGLGRQDRQFEGTARLCRRSRHSVHALPR